MTTESGWDPAPKAQPPRTGDSMEGNADDFSDEDGDDLCEDFLRLKLVKSAPLQELSAKRVILRP